MRGKVVGIFFLVSIVSSTAIRAQQRSAPDEIAGEDGTIVVQPIQHGSVVLGWNGHTVYVDPDGGSEAYEGLAAPDLILISHLHGDHFSPETLEDLNTENAQFVVPQSVFEELPESFRDRSVVLANGQEASPQGLPVQAVAMYNLPNDDTARHPKGWGNGYVVTFGETNVYLSGDTEGTPEMRALEGIDVAFVCMNLPYTMDVTQAASAVLDFEPEIVYPYHHRGQDPDEFRNLVVSENPEIDVRVLHWYPGD